MSYDIPSFGFPPLTWNLDIYTKPSVHNRIEAIKRRAR
jgi:hypothetical protein